MIRITNFLNPASTVAFCEKRLDPEAANLEMSDHEADCLSLDKRDKYITFARQGDYNPVLAAIWKDRINRLDFVRSLENELHSPIMFEAVILLFSADPTVKTLREVCLPLFGAALFRAQQDEKCAVDPAGFSNDGHRCMVETYQKSLQNRVERELTDPSSALFNKYSSWQAIIDEREGKESARAKCIEKLLWAAGISKEIELPPPNWICHHRMGAVMSPDPKKVRDTFATNMEKSWQGKNQQKA